MSEQTRSLFPFGELGITIYLCISLFVSSIEAKLCLSFTLSNGNKELKKDISEQKSLGAATLIQACFS